jgi:hypothetical protein
MRIFISCSHKDNQIGQRLESDLKEQHVSPWIYIKHIKPGENWVKAIDRALLDADYVLGVVTENYLSSIGGDEAYVAIAEGLRSKDIKFIPLFFCSLDNVQSVIIKGIHGIDFTKGYPEGLRDLIGFLKSEESESAKIILSKIESPESLNPFRRVRAEFFRDNYELLAKAFAVPEREKYELIQDDKPVIIFGGRGSGKTMILKSLTPRVLLFRMKAENYAELRKKGINFFGVYLRIEKGSLLIYDNNSVLEMGFAQTGLPRGYELYKKLLEKLNKITWLPSKDIEEEPILTAGLNAVWAITLNELNFKILKTILKELKELAAVQTPIITLGKAIEEKITREISEKLGVAQPFLNDFDSLLKFIDVELLKIGKYVQDLSTPYAKPRADWTRTDIKFLDGLFEILSRNIREFQGIVFYLLLDEFENFRPIQQTIIIEWMKTAQNFVVKVASKFEGMYTHITLQGKPLQFGQDCPHPIELDYDLFDSSKKSAYQTLLLNICSNLLDIEGYTEKDIRKLLEEPKEPEIPKELIDKEIQKIRKNARLEFSPDKINEYRNKLQMAAVFRLLRERRKVSGRKTRKKIYAGFETYTYLSSGIVRIFLNLVGMALYRAEGDGINVKRGESIPAEHQTWAAYVVSRAWLEKIPENYDLKEQGERIYHFIVDLGDILRERLLFHPTEPECLSITLVDPDNLSKNSNVLLNNVLNFSERESLLYKRKETSACRPKQSTKMRGREYILNRIYAPILGLSHRARWGRNRFTTAELGGLLDERKREKIKMRLLNRIKKEDIDEKVTLFDFQEGEL